MKPEIAFVVALDRVGYSPQSIERKIRLSEELAQAVQSSAAYVASQAAGRVLTLDSGDGAALVFFGDPLAAIEAADDIHRAINAPGCDVPLRVAIHTGPVVRRIDVAKNESVSGHGIDLAFRVMSVADGSAILVSEAYAQILRAFDEWASRLSDPTEHMVKHGETLRICRIGEDSRQQEAAGSQQSRGGSQEVAEVIGDRELKMENPLTIALVYKRHTQPDGALLASLESWLTHAGYNVFIDRHMSIGVEWAQEIERQLRAADAVIALLSDRAGDSEMMLYELQVACDERERRGKPAILPVRIGSDTPLTGEIGNLVARYHYFHWTGKPDDERLWSEIDSALRKPPETKATPIAPIEQPGGAVPLDSPYYIERPTDHQFLEAIGRRDSIVLVKGARQMGKTSILARGVHFAREQGWRVVLTDFQTFSSSQLETDERLYKSLMHAFASQLGLEIDLPSCWNDWLGANTNLEQFVSEKVLPASESHLIWAMDEVDRLFNRAYATDFFGMVRSWHNRRALEPQGVWQRLTVAISYATEAHLFITDLNQSPFNVGTRLGLADFTRDQVRELNERYGKPLRDNAELNQLFDLLSGQPYLNRRAFDELVRDGHSLHEIMRLGDQDEGLFGDHLRRLMVALSNDAVLAQAVRNLLAGQTIDSDTFYRLRAGGIITGAGPSDSRFRCRIYETYLRRHFH